MYLPAATSSWSLFWLLDFVLGYDLSYCVTPSANSCPLYAIEPGSPNKTLSQPELLLRHAMHCQMISPDFYSL